MHRSVTLSIQLQNLRFSDGKRGNIAWLVGGIIQQSVRLLASMERAFQTGFIPYPSLMYRMNGPDHTFQITLRDDALRTGIRNGRSIYFHGKRRNSQYWHQ